MLTKKQRHLFGIGIVVCMVICLCLCIARARYGSVSCKTNKNLLNPHVHVVVEPDKNVWDVLGKNKRMSIAFVILRHVKSNLTNNYWIRACKQIRVFYPECVLIIIDDNSNYDFVKITDSEKKEIRYGEILIIQSEYPKRGELLPYLYFIKYKWADAMVCIHDAVFIHKRVEFDKDMMTLWSANEKFLNYYRICYFNGQEIFKSVDHGNELWDIFNRNQKAKSQLWQICFGGMCYIKHDTLMKMHNTFNFHKLIHKVKNRGNRECIERLIPCMYYKLFKSKMPRVLADIHSTGWGRTWEQYCNMPEEKKESLGFVKVWTGR